MSNGSGKGLFLLSVTALGVIVVFAVYQIPQPWRGILVAFLVFMLTFGTFVLRIIRHIYEYKSLQLTTRQPLAQAGRSRSSTRQRRKRAGLNVISPGSAGGGRRIV